MKTKRQASIIMRQASYHVYFLRDVRSIFFCLGFMLAGKGRGYYFSSSLPSSISTRFGNRLVFSVHISQKFNDERGLRKRIQQPYYIFFIIKTSIRVNKGAGFLDLLLNISFQPLIIVVKHSIIKLDVTELLDPPQVFTC